MYLQKSNIFFLFILSLLLMACIDEISLDIETDQKKLTVDGLIADSLDTYTIGLSYSSVIGVGNDNIQEAVRDAIVKVIDDQGNEWLFEETEEGQYRQEMAAVPGASYYLDIKTPDGLHVRSKPQKLHQVPAIDSTSLQIETREYINNAGNFTKEQQVVIFIDTQLDPEAKKPYLRWMVEGEYEFRENYPMALNTKVCFVKDRVGLNQLNVFNTSEIPGDELFGQEVIRTELNYRFAAQYCFHIFQYAISEEEFIYWNNIADIINREGSIFDPPPGTVRGNMVNVDDPDDIVLGYFSVSGISYRRYFVNEDEIGFYIEPRCSPRPFRPQYPICRECLSIFGSTLERPSYWEF